MCQSICECVCVTFAMCVSASVCVCMCVCVRDCVCRAIFIEAQFTKGFFLQFNKLLSPCVLAHTYEKCVCVCVCVRVCVCVSRKTTINRIEITRRAVVGGGHRPIDQARGSGQKKIFHSDTAGHRSSGWWGSVFCIFSVLHVFSTWPEAYAHARPCWEK